jgi:para-nitrobenzyl esterase
MFAVGLCAAQLTAVQQPAAQEPAPVRVEGGLVQGTLEDGLTVYRAIPFAAPPVGDLRWRAPQPPAKWNGVRQAFKFGPRCMQGAMNPGAVGQGPEMSEDCLYLNVWTPAKSARERIPVLVWIYGGGFNAGATSEPNYSGEKLARKGVVLVSIAYRVGLMGFLAHPDLSAETRNHVSGNYGLLDMVAGLQWVGKNIARFGGDPHRVTVFGESAGGIAVSMLCASPLAKGLFHGAISQSGGSFGPPRPTTMPGENLKRLADAERSGEEYAKSAGASSIAELRKLPADRLPAGGRGRGMAWPIIDGWVIPDDQYTLYEARRYNDTPILVGYNSDEGASFSPPKTPDDYISSVKARYGPFAESLLKAYPAGSGTVPKTARDLTRDAAFGWHTWIWARLQAKTGRSRVFYYCLDQHPEYPAGSPRAGFGSPHGMDVAYVFQHLNPSNPQITKSDLAISEAMATYWTNFAKRGDPNGQGVLAWPAFSDANPVVMYFAQTPHTGPVPSAEALKVLDAYFAWRRTPEGEAWVK